jgi:hypothetical protein
MGASLESRSAQSSPRMRYNAYLLSIESDLALPELQAQPMSSSLSVPDVLVQRGPVDMSSRPGGVQVSPFTWVSARQFWLIVPEVARFLVQDGRHIVVDIAPGVDEASVRLFLLGSAMGALLFQRGLLVLHGNAVRVGDQCMVCVGHSGAGKSTTAAGFAGRGHQVLADDVVPVDAQCRALPGFARIKLWKDTAQQLQIATEGLSRIRPGTEKFNLPLDADEVLPALPVRWVYVLESGRVDQVRVTALHGMQRLQPLIENTYRLRYLKGTAMMPQHLERVGQLAGRVHLARVTRPEAGFSLDALVDRLLADMAANP